MTYPLQKFTTSIILLSVALHLHVFCRIVLLGVFVAYSIVNVSNVTEVCAGRKHMAVDKLAQPPCTEGSRAFEPDAFFGAWQTESLTAPYDGDFRRFIVKAFGLQQSDKYVYYAGNAEVTLLKVQTHLELGAQNRMHEWYREADGRQKDAPAPLDISTYSQIFSPTTNTAKALTGFLSNAKKDSLRQSIAKNLVDRYQHPSAGLTLVVPKLKSAAGHINPYFDIWCWTNQVLEWGGPDPDTANTKISHAVLPVLMHHFGCLVPSYEALCIISHFAPPGKRVIDLGSGTGYWTYMLRRFRTGSGKNAPIDVLPIDSGWSRWRTMWIGDTLQTNGIDFLAQRSGSDDVLLLVYPQVSEDFTGKTLRAYKGKVIIVAGTQNSNGYTAFADEMIATWMQREMPHFRKVLQTPLPSFAGKDEALYVFQKTV